MFDWSWPQQTQWVVGTDLRDQFAMAALPAIINEPSMATEFGRDFIARKAYLMADAMLKAREQ